MKTYTARPNYQFSSKHGLYLQQSSYERFSGGVPAASVQPAPVIGAPSQFNIDGFGSGQVAGVQAGDLLVYCCFTETGIYLPGPGIDFPIHLVDDANNAWQNILHGFIDTGNYSAVGREAFNGFSSQFTHDIFWTIHNGNPLTQVTANRNTLISQYDQVGKACISMWRPGRAPLAAKGFVFNSGAQGETAAVYTGTIGTAVPVIPTPASLNSKRIIMANFIGMLETSLNTDGSNMGGLALSSEWYLLQLAGTISQQFTPAITNTTAVKAPFWFMSYLVF